MFCHQKKKKKKRNWVRAVIEWSSQHAFVTYFPLKKLHEKIQCTTGWVTMKCILCYLNIKLRMEDVLFCMTRYSCFIILSIYLKDMKRKAAIAISHLEAFSCDLFWYFLFLVSLEKKNVFVVIQNVISVTFLFHLRYFVMKYQSSIFVYKCSALLQYSKHSPLR